MKKIKLGIGAVIMICAALISERAEIIGVYFLAAFIHELGHLLAAKLLQIPIKEIRLGFSGVRICTDSGVTSYKNELLLAAFGPLANIVCIGISALILVRFDMSFSEVMDHSEKFLNGGDRSVQGAFGFFITSSFLHAFVNLLPINTLDGGRILYCSAALIFNEKIAERLMEIVSAFFAILLWIVALYLLLKVAAGLGVFVFAACIFFSSTVNERNPPK